MELLKIRYYTVFDLLDNAYLTGKKWNNEILPVGFRYLDKISMLFADITWINSASLWQGVSSLWWLYFFVVVLDSAWWRVESKLLKPLNATLYTFMVSQEQGWHPFLHSQRYFLGNPLGFNLFALPRVFFHWLYDSVSAPVSTHHNFIYC